MTQKAIYLPSGEIASALVEGKLVRNEDFQPEYLAPPRQGPLREVLNNLANFQTFGISPFGFPEAAAFPGQAMLSSIDTLNHNLRWYFISNFRQHVSECYVEYGIVRRAVDVPVDDAYRGGCVIKSSQLNEKEIKELQRFMRNKKDFQTCNRTQKWARLYGGGATLAIVEDQDPLVPLVIKEIPQGAEVLFRAVDLWELFFDTQNVIGYGPNLEINAAKFFNYYGQNIHKSRAFRVNGMEIPSFVRPRFRGWGASILESIVRPLNQYLKHAELVFEVLDEFKLDVFMIDGFMQSMADPNGEILMKKRIEYANARKNYHRATVLDAKDKFEQRQLTFSGLSEILNDNRIGLATEIGMPLTKLFGLSATGFNAGEEDLENYNMMIEGTIRPDEEYLISQVTEIRCQQLFGDVPDDLEYEFPTLRVLSSTDESTVKRNKAQTLAEAFDRNVLTKEEYRESLNAGKLVDVRLDNSPSILAELESAAQEAQEAEAAAGGAEGGKKGKDAGKKGEEDKEGKEGK